MLGPVLKWGLRAKQAWSCLANVQLDLADLSHVIVVEPAETCTHKPATWSMLVLTCYAVLTLERTTAVSPEPYTTDSDGTGIKYSAFLSALYPNRCRHRNLQAITQIFTFDR